MELTRVQSRKFRESSNTSTGSYHRARRGELRHENIAMIFFKAIGLFLAVNKTKLCFFDLSFWK